MRYISIFSGIEAASVAFHPLGWEPVAFSEIDPFPSAVLAHRYPDVPNLGDITKIDWKPYRGRVDLVVGGSPCQSFSIAGKREGLQGESGLMYEFIRCVREVRPRWFLWENVPGALSSEHGAAFGQLLDEMADGGGYGCAWRVLDAQFFGVAQRRRRLFLVGRAGNGFREACQVLFEPESLRWDTPSSREKRQALTRGAAGCVGKADWGCMTPWDGQSRRVYRSDGVFPTLNARDGKAGADGRGVYTSNSEDAFLGNCSVRRITPVECERLQGFPDGWTDIPYRGKPHASDSVRYKALGNSMAVPVMRWIGRRILDVDADER